MIRKILHTLDRLLTLFAVFWLGVFLALQLPMVQSILTNKLLEVLNQEHGTKINVKNVKIDFWGQWHLEGIHIKDHKNRTLIKAENLTCMPDLWQLVKDKKLRLKTTDLEKPQLHWVTYKGEKESNLDRFIDALDSSEPSENPLQIEGDLRIKEGLIKKIDQNEKQTLHWQLSHVNAEFKDVYLFKDQVKAKIENLSTHIKGTDENLLVIHSLSGLFLRNNQKTALQNYIIKTEQTLLEGKHLVLSHKHKNAFEDFASRVNLSIDLKNGSKINPRDLQFFFPTWNAKAPIYVKMQLDGFLSKLKIKNLDLHTDARRSQIKSSELILRNLDESKHFSIDLKSAQIRTNYQDLKALLPSVLSKKIPETLAQAHVLDFNGNLLVDADQIKAQGSLASSHFGKTQLKAQLENYSDVKKIRYKVNANVHQIALSLLTKDKNLGETKGYITLDGQGLDSNHLQSQLQIKLETLQYKDKKCENISLTGHFKDNSFSGVLQSQNHWADLTAEGFVYFKNKAYNADIKADVKHLDLTYLNINDLPKAQLSGSIELKGQGSALNNMEGKLWLNDFQYSHSGKTYEIKTAKIELDKPSSLERNIKIDAPNMLVASVVGRFQLSELKDLITNTLHRFSKNFPIKKVTKNQHIDFDISFWKDFTNLFYPKLVLNNDENNVKGFLDGDSNRLELNLQTPGLGFNKNKLTDVSLKINTEDPDQQAILSIEKAIIEGQTLNNIEILATQKQKGLNLETHFQWPEQEVERFFLSIYPNIKSFKTFDFAVAQNMIQHKENTWMLEPNKDSTMSRVYIDLARNQYKVEPISLVSNQQKIYLEGIYERADKYNGYLQAQNVDLAKVLPAISQDMAYKGVFNAQITVRSEKGIFKPDISAHIDKFGLGPHAIGNVYIEADYSDPDKNTHFNVQVKAHNTDKPTLFTEGHIHHREKEPQIDAKITLKDQDVGFLNGFFSGVLKNVRGKAQGDINIKGSLKDVDYNGNINLEKAGFKVDYLNTDYAFEQAVNLNLTKGVFLLSDLPFVDSETRTRGHIYGAVLNKDFKEWYLDLTIDTDNLLILNTRKEQNPLFYGTIYAKGHVSLSGPVEALEINVLNAKTQPGSKLVLNLSSTKTIDDSDFIRYVSFYSDTLNHLSDDAFQYKNVLEESSKEKPISSQKKASKLGLNIQVDVTPQAEMEIIVDEQLNSKLNALGQGELQLSLNPAGNFSIKGLYNVESGKYNFSLQTFTEKIFQLRKGGTLQWTGDPLKARINLAAIYKKTVSNIGEYLENTKSYMVDTDLIIYLKNTLDKPDISFDVIAQDAPSAIKDELTFRMRNPDERLKQFAGILGTGKFITNDKGADLGVSNSFYDLGLGQLSGWLSSISEDVNFDIERIAGNQSLKKSDVYNISAYYRLNPRISINGKLGVPVEKGVDNIITGQVNLTADITKNIDGRLTLSLFTRPAVLGLENLNTASSYAQEYGIGINYKESFDYFGQFISRIFRKNLEKNKANLENLPKKEIKVEPIENQTDILKIKP